MSETPTISIQELFDRDPLERSDAEFALLVEHYRKNRVAFNSGISTAGNTKVAAKAAEADKKAKSLGVDLDSTLDI